MKSPLIHFGLMLVAFIVAVTAYGFWYAAVSHKSQAVAALQSQIDAAHENATRITKARAALAEIANDETNVRSYFVPESGVVAFIDTLQARGLKQKASVSVPSVSTGGTEAAPTLVLSLSIQGTFDAVMRTVGSIEYAPYALSVTSLVLALDDKDMWHATLGFSVGSSPMTASTTVSSL